MANQESATGPLLIDEAGFRLRYPAEGDDVEFKQGVPEHKVAEAVTAFSNARGGTILVGVGPKGELHGTNVDGEAQARLHRVMATVTNPGRYRLDVIVVDQHPLVALVVEPRREGFAQTPDGRVLQRRGAMNAALLGDDLATFVSRRSLTRFERTAVPATLADADAEALAGLSGAFGWSTDIPDRLAEHGLCVTGAEPPQLTVAGALHLLADPSSVLGKAYVEVFRYRGEQGLEDKRYDIRGPLAHVVRRTTAAIIDEIGHESVVIGLRRHDLERIPVVVLREAVANAVAHRVYEDHRRPVRVDIHPGRVVVTSPGPLPEPVTVENIRQQNAARNIAVIGALRRLGLAEDAGRGVDLIQDAMAENLLDPPVFTADPVSVSVTLPLTTTVTAAERAWLGDLEGRESLRAADRAVLVQALRGRTLTNTAVRELLGIDSTRARASLHRLRDAGFLVQEGERAGARYLLAPGQPSSTRGLSSADLRRAILDMAGRGPVTNALVRSQLGVDREGVLRALQHLVGEGRLDVQGSRRGTTYVLANDG